MKVFILLSLALVSTSSFAKSEDAAQVLLDGSTLCSSPNNPMIDGLKKRGGDYFTSVSISEDGVVTAAMIHDPSVYNTAIKAPAVWVGEIKFKKSYVQSPNSPDNLLTCELQIKTIME